MIKYIIIFIVSFTCISFPQNVDSLRNIARYDTTRVDSIKATDSLQTGLITVQKDSIVTIQGKPFSETSSIIDKKTFLFTNYRYAGDFLRSFPFNYIKDLGFIGQPHETFIYGVGSGGISFLQDGVLWNNRFTNSLDLNFIQSEDIDSIEIVPAPRGFLYGPNNSPVAVNFITRDFVSKEPYSRIKYYEGPDGEAMIDGKFNAHILRRWNLSFQGTNRIVDKTYNNCEFSIWQANVKLKYFLSNDFNFSAAYYFVKSEQGLNGGVNVDSIKRITTDINSILYDPQQAPVLYPDRTLDVTQHNLLLRILEKPFEDSKLDISFYYKFNLDELRDVQDSISIAENTETKTFGTTLNYLQNYGVISLNVFGTYEGNNTINSSEYDYKYLAAGGILTFHFLNDIVNPSFFYKFEQVLWGKNNYSVNNPGFGFDLQIKPIKDFTIYTGYSISDQYDDGLENYDGVKSFEAGGNYDSEILRINLKYFERKNFIPFKLSVPWWWRPDEKNDKIFQNNNGIGLTVACKLWLILFEGNFSHYFNLGSEDLKQLPDYQFSSGLYVNDKFFDNHLDLKTGFVFYYTGKSVYDYYLGEEELPSSNKIDFTLTGEIQKVAIVYFIWENLFDEEYYITPYYPMPGRNIRFGLSWEIFN